MKHKIQVTVYNVTTNVTEFVQDKIPTIIIAIQFHQTLPAKILVSL
jgi:hypothetical protein